jgi:sulfotransferase
MKKLFFLSGLPRSGSTLLGSILNQNLEVYTSPTSPLADLLCFIDSNFNSLDIQYTYDKEKIQHNTYNAVISNFYNHIPKKYILDKHRAWPKNLIPVKKFYTDNPKVIATYRSIPEVISSFITLIERTDQQDNFVDNKLIQDNLEINNSNRAEYLWRFFISDPYQSLIYGLRHFRENIHLVEYNNFVQNPEEELNKIYDFLGIDSYQHDFFNILNTCKEEKDKEWGMEELHNIRSVLQKTSKPPEEVIGEENVKLYSLFNIDEK